MCPQAYLPQANHRALRVSPARALHYSRSGEGLHDAMPPGIAFTALGLLLSQLPAAAGELEADDPCARRCGREHTCGELNVSFTCEVLSSGMGCNCDGCCLATEASAFPHSSPEIAPRYPS